MEFHVEGIRCIISMVEVRLKVLPALWAGASFCRPQQAVRALPEVIVVLFVLLLHPLAMLVRHLEDDIQGKPTVFVEGSFPIRAINWASLIVT